MNDTLERIQAEAIGLAGAPGEGPWFRLTVTAAAGMISDVRYETYACTNAHRCGAFLTQWLIGRTPEQAMVIEPGDLVKILDVPLGKEHVAALAVTALRAAISQLGGRE